MPAPRTDDPEPSRFIRFGKEAVDTAVAANKIVCKRVLQMADHDMRTFGEAFKAGLEIVMPVTGRERLTLSDTGKTKSDAFLRAGKILFRGAWDTAVIAAETRSELHHLIYERLRDAVDLLGPGDVRTRPTRDGVVARVKTSEERPSTPRGRSRSTKPTQKTAGRGSAPTIRGHGPMQRKRVRPATQGTAAHNSLPTRKSSVTRKPSAPDRTTVDKKAQQDDQILTRPSDE